MAISYDTEDLGKTLDKLEAQLAKSEEEKPDTAADLAKAMADVATKALDLATDDRTTSTKRRKAKAEEAEAEALAKAREHGKDDDKDDDDDDDDDDEMPAWLKDKVHDGKAAGEMVFPYDRTETGTHQGTNAGGESRGSVSKSMRVGDLDVVDIDEYLAKALGEQGEMTKALKTLSKLSKTMMTGLAAIDQRIATLEAQQREQARYTGVCAKALGYMLEHREAYLDQPAAPSRYAAMEKSVVLAQRQIEADGGTLFKMSGEGSQRNRELLSKAMLTGKITQEQMTFIKKTERLPAGITLN